MLTIYNGLPPPSTVRDSGNHTTSGRIILCAVSLMRKTFSQGLHFSRGLILYDMVTYIVLNLGLCVFFFNNVVIVFSLLYLFYHLYLR